ncbi:MAG: SRPBCC domain-containing protein [Gammaproteobacteria bacterium]
MTALTHEFTETLAATRETVFRALTDEAELGRWFAERVEIEPRAGGEFRFWGKHTHGAPTRAQASQKILRIEAPSLLAFSWRLEDRDSEVTLELTPDPTVADGSATVVKGRHYFPVAPDVPRPLDLVDDLWRMTFANLRAHLAGGSGLYLADFSDPRPRLRQTVLISASREEVFRTLLDPALLDKWIAAGAIAERHVGGRYSYGWKYEVRGKQVEGGPTRILELVEDAKLVTDWPNWRGVTEMPPQRITWLLEAIGDQTRVTLIHEPFERTADLSDYPQGWNEFLGRLKTQAEAISQPPGD